MSAPVALNRESLNAGRKRPRFKYASAADIGRIAVEVNGALCLASHALSYSLGSKAHIFDGVFLQAGRQSCCH